MKIQKKLFKCGASLAIIIGKELLKGKDMQEGDIIEIDLNDIKKVENSNESK